MTNADHVEIVRSGSGAISAFRAANPDIRLDLSDSDLSQLNLRDSDLNNANLNNADLNNADLCCADLCYARMMHTNLTNAQLNNADLCYARMNWAILDNADLRVADLARVELSAASAKRACFDHARLENANLSGANLMEASLSGANLSGANLTIANLRTANLIDANLSGANLSGALLSGANLSGALLSNADLSGANLSGANFSGANLKGAKLNDAGLSSTVFADLDLSAAIGLESVRHIGPSSIGVDTLMSSNGTIPSIFLRGCGLSDDFIEFIPSLARKPFDFYSCFISYSHKDKQFARQLHDRLQGKGIRCWLDEKELNPGDDLYHGIDRGIRVWDKVLLCSSKHSLNSWWCDNEIRIALDKERELQKTTGKKLLKIIPLNLDGFLFSDKWESGYRQQVRDRVAADFTKWKKDADEFDRQFEGVLKALRTDGAKLPEPKSKLT